MILALLAGSCKKDKDNPTGTLQLTGARIGNVVLNAGQANPDMPYDSLIYLTFSAGIDQTSLSSAILLKTAAQSLVPVQLYFGNDQKTIIMNPLDDLAFNADYTLEIGSSLEGVDGESFPGVSISFKTKNGKLKINSLTICGLPANPSIPLSNIPFDQVEVEIHFSHPLDTLNAAGYFYFSGNNPASCLYSDSNKTVTITALQPFQYYQKYSFAISPSLKGANGFSFSGYAASFFTSLDSSVKFPLLSDEVLLQLIQQQTFKYFYEGAHPASGMIRERSSSGDIVTSGGSGFGLMALIVGMHRGFISRNEGTTRLDKILDFLETCDRYHGVWAHWINGNTGATIPFSTNDNGADLVETSYMVQGLMTMRQYLDPAIPAEASLISRINGLMNAVEWDFFTRGQNVLYWHWSPTAGWAMNMKISGYNEALITYVMAASSTTHTISPAVYQQGWALNGSIVNGNSYYGYTLPLGYSHGGPLFFAHYSFLGLDPRNLSDAYANYWTQNVNHSLINYAYCVDNPRNYTGYSSHCWGLTASDNPWGYNAHSPTNDLGVISPTAAVSSLPYTPLQSMNAIRHFYYILGDRLWGQYGFYDAFAPREGWWAGSYLAIDQGPMICMIENFRSGLLWDLFMSAPEVQQGLTKLGFTY